MEGDFLGGPPGDTEVSPRPALPRRGELPGGAGLSPLCPADADSQHRPAALRRSSGDQKWVRLEKGWLSVPSGGGSPAGSKSFQLWPGEGPRSFAGVFSLILFTQAAGERAPLVFCSLCKPGRVEVLREPPEMAELLCCVAMTHVEKCQKMELSQSASRGPRLIPPEASLSLPSPQQVSPP